MGKRRDLNKGFWMSFENHPQLRETKNSIYARCVPCLEKLHTQLQSSPRKLSLEEPLDCWKVVVVVNGIDEGLALLELYQDEMFPVKETFKGRLGTNGRESSRIAVIFQLHDERQRDQLLADLEKIAGKVAPDFILYYERGCGNIYGTLCGDWKKWKKRTPIKNISAVPLVAKKVEELLKGNF